MKLSHLITAAVVAALAGYLAYDLRTEKTEKAQKELESKLFDLNFDQVNRVRLQKGSEPAVQLSRTENGWSLDEPVQDQSDNLFVDDFVQRLLSEKVISVAREGEDLDLAVYGLTEPLGFFEFQTQSGEVRKLLISGKSNFENNSFARIEGQPRVLVVNSAWASHLDRTARDFRDKRLFRGRIGEIRSLQWKNPKGEFALERQDNTWKVRGESDLELDQNRVRELLTMLNETRIYDVSSESPSSSSALQKRGLRRPVVTLEARVGDEGSWRVDFGRDSEKQEFALVSEPAMILELEAVTLEKFERVTLDGLREKKKAFDVDLSSVQKMRWKTPLKTTLFVKENGKWSIEGQDQALDSARVQKWIEEIRDARVERYAQGGETRGFQGSNQLQLFGQNQDKPLFEMSWGESVFQEASSRTRLAKTNLISEVFHFPEDQLQSWTAEAAEWSAAKTTAPSETEKESP